MSEINENTLRSILNSKFRYAGRDTIKREFNMSDSEARGYILVIKNMGVISKFFETDEELVVETVKSKKQAQRFRDMNRIERKAFTGSARVENAVSSYVKELCSIFDSAKSTIKLPYVSPDATSYGIIHITDTHFNELIDVTSNKYDFTIASKRMNKLALEAIKYFRLNDVSDVFLFFTGDLMNSDRRLDELLAMATNRAKATFIAVQILEQFILHIRQHFNVHIAGVCGNESRVGKDYNWQNDLVSDNYDFTIFNSLRYKMKSMDGIEFMGISDEHEAVVEVCGRNVLLLHGHQLSKDLVKSLSKVVRKYADNGTIIHYIIFGHLHEALIADTYSRASSLCGANTYSENALQLTSRASQNIHLFTKTSITSIKVDLQDTTGYEGYDNESWQDAYNPKSVSKTRTTTTVFKVVI